MNLLSKYRWLLLLGVFVAWTLLVWKGGYDKGRGEVDKKQTRVEVSDEKNKTLATELIRAQDKISSLTDDLEIALAESDKKHKDVVIVEASKCTGSDDYFGNEAEADFMRKFNKQGEAILK